MDNLVSKAESIVALVERELSPQPYWIEPFILPKSGMLLFGGEAKTGKSMVMLELLRALTTGEAPFGVPDFVVPEQAKVLFIECELGIYGLQDRAKRIVGGSLEQIRDRFFYVSKDPSLSFSSPKGVERILSLVEDVKPNVLALDPIGKLHFFDENSNTEVAKLFNRIEKIQKAGEAQQMSIILSHHFGKPSQSQLENQIDRLSPYAFRGASKWFDNPDTLVTMSRVCDLPNKAWRLRTHWITRHGPQREDMLFTINKKGNLETRFESLVSQREAQEPSGDKEDKTAEKRRKLFSPE